MRTDFMITSSMLLVASCAVAPSAIKAPPATTSRPTASDLESGATVAFSVGRNVVGRYQIALGFQDGRAFRLYWGFASDATVADVVNALAKDLRGKGLEVATVPEFGALRIAFTKGLFRVEASGPEGFTFESHVGKRDELASDPRRSDEALSSDFEVIAPVASLRLLRFVEGPYGREGVFELRNLSPDTLHYSGISSDFPCSFEDEEWKNGERRQENRVTCGNGTSRYSLGPGAVVEFSQVMSEEMFTYLKSARVGVHLDGVPGAFGRGVDVWSELITLDTN